MRWLVLRLHAPLAAFGGEMIDAYGVTRDFPALSAMTGLFANALGYERYERQKHQALQDRLVFAVRRDAEPLLGRLQDYQTARLYQNDRGWTTRGRVEGRETSPSYVNSDAHGKWLTYQRYRDYHADARLTAVLALTPAAASPTLDDLAAALDRPARPLFIGRKSCLPSRRLLDGEVEADTARAALLAAPALPASAEMAEALWPLSSGGGEGADRLADLTDERNWRTGLHGGARRVAYGRLAPDKEVGP
jgi:CRISPR system Cascade subunit CasD